MKTNFDSSAVESPATVGLPRRQLLRIDRRDGIRRIHVRDGVVWLTGSPAREDVLVKRGEEYRLPAAWPFVLEALSDARVELLA
jgi:hypothetical protein